MATIVRNAHARRLAPGISEQHAADCLKSIAWPRARCTCAPVYDAWIRDDSGVENAVHATREEAEAWLAEARSARRPRGAAAGVAFGTAVAAFLARVDAGVAVKRSGGPYRPLTAAFYRRALERLVLEHRDQPSAPRLGELSLHAVDDHVLERVVEAILESSGSATAQTTRCALQALFRDLVERGDLEHAPVVPSVPDTPVAPRREPYGPAQIEQVLIAARHDDQRLHRTLVEPLIVLMLGSGAGVRPSLRLSWGRSSLDLDARDPRVVLGRPGVGGATSITIVALTPTVAAVLRQHHARLGSPADGSPVFPAKGGGGAVHIGLVYAALRRVANAAGLANLSPLALRTTGAAAGPMIPFPTEPEEARR